VLDVLTEFLESVLNVVWTRPPDQRSHRSRILGTILVVLGTLALAIILVIVALVAYRY
jgi:hypothetical protein